MVLHPYSPDNPLSLAEIRLRDKAYTDPLDQPIERGGIGIGPGRSEFVWVAFGLVDSVALGSAAVDVEGPVVVVS